MIVIRRMVDRRRAYTAIFLKGEPPKIFPTSDAEHARILQVYKQDRPHEGILNDFSPDDSPPPSTPASSAPRTGAPSPWPLAKSAPQPRKKAPAKKSTPPTKKKPRATPSASPRLWLTTTAHQA